MKLITQICRVLVGVLFIISGFIKANDTIGFSYKLVEYFEIFNMHFFVDYAVPMAMFICVFEIIVGVALLLGAFNRLNMWLMLLMIIFFTLLTGYSAITGKVTDCGCFGDAIKLTPVQSFFKDVVLLVLILILFIYQFYINPLFNKSITAIAMGISLVVTVFFTMYTYMFLPRIDFLPYKVGNDIAEKRKLPEGAKKDSVAMVFIYEKDGKQMEFGINELDAVDDSYNFVDRKDKVIVVGDKAPIPDFHFTNADGVEYTDSLLLQSGFKLILVQTHLQKSRKGMEPLIAKLYQQATENGVAFWALTNSNFQDIDIYRHEHQLFFPYYNMDATPLKSMVRSNPGLLLLKDNVVIKKWSAYGLPTFDQVKLYMEGKVGDRGIRPKN
jgi:uncharacterized membrane protein YphA (DoxX/SURF4 family)